MASDARPARVSLRQLVLFVLSMVVPSIVLVGLGVRIIVQQEELADKHAADQQRLQANELERALATQLDRMRLEPSDPSVALVATVADGRLILPWETKARAASPVDAAFDARIGRAEREEFADRLNSALAELEPALERARSDGQRAHARLMRARIFAKAQRPMDADADYRLLLTVPLSIGDEDGMPFALYAADRLLTSGRASETDREAIAAIAERAAQTSPAPPPAAWYLLRRVEDAVAPADDAKARPRRELIARRIADVEHALALQRDIQALVAQWKAADGVWLPHGAPLWLVGASSQDSLRGRLLVAVRAEAVLKTSGITIASPNGAGEWLGDRFPGLKVNFPPLEPNATQGLLRRGFYAALLAIVLSVTLFGGYLLWRDVDREMRIATLRSHFVSSVSHELKTPLTAIRMFAETLQLNRVDLATREEYLDTIVNETERLTRLLNNVLDFSKIEEGRKAYRREATSLARLVRLAARAMTYPLEQHGFQLHVTVDESLPPVDVDADALEQAILNLLTNAMKYSGGGRTIELSLTRDGAHAVISVRDEGIGISLADQSRIFEKFYRISTPETQRIPGTGLGLTLVDHIVKAHEGVVRVDSAPGRGSRFSILLPLAAADVRAVAMEAAS